MDKRIASYDVFGSSSTVKTLTEAYVTDSRGVILTHHAKRIQLDVTFTPGTTGEFLDILVGTSNAAITAIPSTFQTWSDYRQPDNNPPTELDVMGVTFAIPKETAAPASGTAYRRSFQIDVASAWVRIQCKSSLAALSTFGTAYVVMTVIE